LGTGQQFHRFCEGAVAGDLAVMGVVQADDLGEHVGVPGVGLRPGGGVPFPVSRHRHRVDRKHLIPGREQCLHPGAAVGLDPDPHPPGRFDRLQVRRHVLRDQCVQPADAVKAFRQPCARQPPTVVAEKLYVVVVLGPVVPDPDHPRLQCRRRR
jgi:hypothetical protein